MEHRTQITVRINGETLTKNVEDRTNLVDFIRYEVGLTGSHVGCEHGVCGACTLRVDGRIARGCLTLAVQADGCDVWTIEGVSETGEIRHLQDAQCGFCTPGMLLTVAELMDQNPNANREEIREYISGNFCRCTGYQAIVDAVEIARDKGAVS